MSQRRKANLQSSEILTVTPLGAGNEVGRSCIVLSYKNKNVMLDCGIHPAYNGLAALPFFDEIDPASIDIVLITHFHLDHAASLPYFLEKTSFKGKVYMTHPTKAIYKWLLSDYVKVSNAGSDDNLYTEQNLIASHEKIIAIDYHQTVEHEGIKFTAYNAGHVLGAAMFLVEIAGVKVLYTGDYSREEDRHLKAAEVPSVRPDVLICESTYGVQSHQSRAEREYRFTSLVHDIVKRGGRCLIPVFALGRAQELLLILDEYWQAHPELHSIPVYYASSLAKKCMAVYQTYVNMMNERIRRQITVNNPFIFKHISNIKSMEQFEDVGPCVMMSSPGMLQNGMSRELFELWCPNKRNGVIIPGYCVEGTLAKHILSEPSEVSAMSGAKIPLRMTVEYISFSAHVDYTQNAEFIETVKPHNLILVHGESTEMNRLKNAIQHKFEEKEEMLSIFTPRNCEPVEIEYRGEKILKLIGSIAKEPLKNDTMISGVLVGKDFEYQVMDSADLVEYTSLTHAKLLQKQVVTTAAPFSLIEYHMIQMFGQPQVSKKEGFEKLRIAGVINLSHIGNGVICIEWPGNNVNDIIADSVLTLLMHAECSRSSVKLSKSSHAHCDHHSVATSSMPEVLHACLTDHFGSVEADLDSGIYNFEFDGHAVQVDADLMEAKCSDTKIKEIVDKVLQRFSNVLNPDFIL